MGSRAVPFGVRLAAADDETITHIERNHQFLTFESGHSTLADHTHREVDVVVGGDDLLGDFARGGSRDAAHGIEHQALNYDVVVLGIGLGYHHIGNVAAHLLALEVTGCCHQRGCVGNYAPVLPHLLPEVAAAAVGSEGIVALWRLADFDEVVAGAHCADGAVERDLVHVHALEHAGQTTLGEVELTNILGPSTLRFDVATLEVGQEFLDLEDGR